MLRVFAYLVIAALVAFGLAWFAEQPGGFTVEWLSYSIHTTLFVAVVAITLGVMALLFIISVLRQILGTPWRISRRRQLKRQARGYNALRKGVFAVGAGDETLAARYAAEARRNLPKEPLTELLLAQSAQLSGDRRTAQRIFEAMSEKNDTQLLGLRGLFLEASRDDQMEAAQQFAARAMALNPSLPWPVHALFEMQCRSRNWAGALETLNVARNFRHVDRRTAERRRAVLLTAQAIELEAVNPEKAAELALDAHRLAPGLVPAAVLAGRILASRDSAHKAARVLARTWQYTPHPDLAIGYAYVRPGDSPRDRLGRIKSLIILTPDHLEARIALARAAADARDWEEAREALAPLLTKNPTARVCALMARIEGGEKRDAGRVREWLARAVRAPRDATWMADGVASAEWAPISPVTGALDAFEWRVPVEQSRPGPDDALMDEVSALSRELESVTRVEGAMEPEMKTSGSAQPITITVKAVETPRETRAAADTAKPATPPVVKVMPEAKRTSADTQRAASGPAAAEEQLKPPAAKNETGTDKTPGSETARGMSEVTGTRVQRKVETRIFVSDRPPDDPGPDPNGDVDEDSTPISRYRSALK